MKQQVRLLDIEGTIGDIAFVRQTLFPYARARFEPFLLKHWKRSDIQELIKSAGQFLQTPIEAARLFQEWSDADLKVTPLKDLQGLIWREGYETGTLRAHLYPDAIKAIRQWADLDGGVWIYSSGSIGAQKLYFTYSDFGDVTSLLRGYFDTTSGPKTRADSYTGIARSIGVSTTNILFLTDMPNEARAARDAGCMAALIDRSKSPDWSGSIDDLPAYGSLTALII